MSSTHRKLLRRPVLPSRARGELGSTAEPESSRRGEQVSEIWEGRGKAVTTKKAQLNYPHPSSNFCSQLRPENHPLAATFMSCEVGFPVSSFWFPHGDKISL